WKSVLCNPKRAAFLGGSPSNLNDMLTQIKRCFRWKDNAKVVESSKNVFNLSAIKASRILLLECIMSRNLTCESELNPRVAAGTNMLLLCIGPTVTYNWAICCTLNPPVLPPIPPEGAKVPGETRTRDLP
nr:cellulose synthase-like protein G3 [Tanacetum cinerariifolium]